MPWNHRPLLNKWLVSALISRNNVSAAQKQRGFCGTNHSHDRERQLPTHEIVDKQDPGDDRPVNVAIVISGGPWRRIRNQVIAEGRRHIGSDLASDRISTHTTTRSTPECRPTNGT